VSKISAFLQRAGGQYILGEKLSGNRLNEMALAHPGRFKVLTDNLHIKEVFAGEGTGRRRYVIAYNPQQAELDRINREQILERLSCELQVLNQKKKPRPSARSYCTDRWDVMSKSLKAEN
jgi:hypothetical protein